MTICFFFVTPAVFFLIQYFVTRSKRIPKRRKYVPLALMGGVAALTWSAVFGWIPLPHTYLIDQGSFLAFPDFVYAGLFCIPALFGLMMGAIIGVAAPGEEEKG